MDLVHLAGLCGSDVSDAVGMNVAMAKPAAQTSPRPEPTCSPGIPPEGEMYDPPPAPVQRTQRATRKSSKMTPSSPMSSWEDPMWTTRLELVRGHFRPPPIDRRDAAVQCELQGEIPKKVFMIPRGTCVHALRSCSTLNMSTRFQERDMCQKCVRGQKEETDYRGSDWLR